jgi:YVTN family beta-propeller protein
MKFHALLLAVGGWLSAVSGQWLEATVELPITSIPISMVSNPAGTKLYVTNVNSDSSCVHIIDAVNNTLLGRIPCGSSPGWLCYNTLSNKLYVPVPDGSITVIDATADTVLDSVAIGRYPGNLVFYAARNRLYCTCGDDYTLVVIDAGPDTVIKRIPLSYSAGYLCLNAAEDKLYVSIAASPWVEVIDCSADTVSGHITLPSNLGPPCLSTQQNKLFWADVDSLVFVVDCAADTIVRPPIGVGLWPRTNCHNPATDKAYFGNYASQDVAIIDCATSSLRASIELPSIPCGICADPVTGNVYVTSRQTRQVFIVDGSGDSVLAVVDVGETPGTAYWGTGRHRAYIANEHGHSVSVLRDAPGGVEETPSAEVRAASGGPTVVSGVLELGRLGHDTDSRSGIGSCPAHLLDISGRKVLDLKTGPNDVSRLAPGIYFVSSRPSAVGLQPTAVRRIVIQR